MAAGRSYKLLCPIARGLDRVGDRWTLLILRDLHAGPARFSDLISGLAGIASNLLSTRLQQLVDDGLVQKRQGDFGAALYELTEGGARTNDLLFELARIGGRFPPTEEMKRPPNLRPIVVTLKTALQRAVDAGAYLQAELMIDSEPFVIEIENGCVDVRSGRLAGADVKMSTSYEPLVAAGDGRMSLDTFMAEHCQTTADDPAKLAQLADLLAEALTQLE